MTSSSKSDPSPAIPGGSITGAERCSAKAPVIPVAAGCLLNARGEVLIAQRPAGKIAAGKWEFPGGKIEPGETPRAALERELREELGVAVTGARPLIRVRHDYSDRTVILDTWLVTAFEGEPHPHDDQALAWVAPEELFNWDLLAADKPIVAALRLPADYVFTPPDADRDFVLRGLARLPSRALLRLRLPSLDEVAYGKFAAELIPAAHARDLRVVLDRAPQLVQELGADGWHAPARRVSEIAAAISGWRIASCHSAEELRRARLLGFDAAVLGPLRPTPSHPGQAPLGWKRFEALAAECGLPVYAIGGVGPEDRDEAFAHYAQGVAGISAYWS